MFIDHCQEQWLEWLETAEFAYNNKVVINRLPKPKIVQLEGWEE